MNRKILLSATAALALLAARASAQDQPWHRYSLRLFGGAVGNAATLNDHDGYNRLKLGHDFEYGLSGVMALQREFEVDFALSHWTANGKQYNDPHTSWIDADVGVYKFSVTGRKRFEYPDLFVPWIGLGPDLALIEKDETENVGTGGGTYRKDTRKTNSSTFGLHAGGGVDIYPRKDSALAFFLEARYTVYIYQSSFNGDINGYTVLAGLRWDFSQHGIADMKDRP